MPDASNLADMPCGPVDFPMGIIASFRFARHENEGMSQSEIKLPGKYFQRAEKRRKKI